MKHIILFVIALLSATFSACASEPEQSNSESTENNNMESYKMYITINGTTMTATMVANSSTAALKNLLERGDITIDMHDFSNFEKVGELPESLPQNNQQITTQACDLILYLGRNFVIYYDTNSWNFTRLGKIENLSQAELKAILGPDNCTARLSLNTASVTSANADNDANTAYYRPDGTIADANAKGVIVEKNGSKVKKTFRR